MSCHSENLLVGPLRAKLDGDLGSVTQGQGSSSLTLRAGAAGAGNLHLDLDVLLETHQVQVEVYQLAACGVGGDGDRARIVQGRVAHTDQLILDGRIAGAALVALGDGQLHGHTRRGAGGGADLDGQDAGEEALAVDGVLAGVRGHFDTLNKCAFHS
ncbi:hypothetical protein 2209_scaffold2350_00025 [Bacteriophage sp.]|nr:hypothetical protein 2209_scaffold2350_00025 [Bacteriophage sp.]